MGVDEYVISIKKGIDAGWIKLKGNPIIAPIHPFTAAAALVEQTKGDGGFSICEADLLALVLKPVIFAWIPDRLFPDLVIKCPSCGSVVVSREWADNKIAHDLERQLMYITVKYRCFSCIGKICGAGRLHDQLETAAPHKKKDRKFQADAPETLAMLPAHVSALWRFVHTGKILCEDGVIDFINAMATRTSWSGISDTINELKESAWNKTHDVMVPALARILGVRCNRNRLEFPGAYCLSAAWVRNVYVSESQKRRIQIRNDFVTTIPTIKSMSLNVRRMWQSFVRLL